MRPVDAYIGLRDYLNRLSYLVVYIAGEAQRAFNIVISLSTPTPLLLRTLPALSDMTNSDRDGHITLEVLPLESDRWSNLEPMDIEWLRSSISTDEEKLRERMDAIQKEYAQSRFSLVLLA